ncbi:MAG: hypothetical protein V4692_09010, partial [Bdellovibrionota bacterium]
KCPKCGNVWTKTEKSPDKTGIFFWDNSATNISTPGEPMGTKIDFEIRGGKCYPANVKSQDIKDFYTFVNMDDCLKTRAPDEIRKLIDTKTKENLLLAERLLNCKHVPLLEEMKQVFSPIENGTIRSETLRTVR